MQSSPLMVAANVQKDIRVRFVSPMLASVRLCVKYVSVLEYLNAYSDSPMPIIVTQENVNANQDGTDQRVI